jgi:hypothetical protein
MLLLPEGWKGEEWGLINRQCSYRNLGPLDGQEVAPFRCLRVSYSLLETYAFKFKKVLVLIHIIMRAF